MNERRQQHRNDTTTTMSTTNERRTNEEQRTVGREASTCDSRCVDVFSLLPHSQTYYSILLRLSIPQLRQLRFMLY